MPIREQHGRVSPLNGRTAFGRLMPPAGVRIPSDDFSAYRWNEAHRWVYNRLFLAGLQGVEAAPHGIAPSRYPVFSRSIYGLPDAGQGSRTLGSAEEYRRHLSAGHFWMRLLAGEPVRTELAVVRGSVRWLRHAAGLANAAGIVDQWFVEGLSRDELSGQLEVWVRRHLGDYTGMLNLGTIDGIIVAARLRATDQWPDLNGSGWPHAVVGLYASGRWRYPETERRPGYSLVLFGPIDRCYRHPPAALLYRLRRSAQISSVQITFDEGRANAARPLARGSFRLAVVNAFELGAGLRAREELRRSFLCNPPLEFLAEH